MCSEYIDIILHCNNQCTWESLCTNSFKRVRIFTLTLYVKCIQTLILKLEMTNFIIVCEVGSAHNRATYLNVMEGNLLGHQFLCKTSCKEHKHSLGFLSLGFSDPFYTCAKSQYLNFPTWMRCVLVINFCDCKCIRWLCLIQIVLLNEHLLCGGKWTHRLLKWAVNTSLHVANVLTFGNHSRL